MSGHESIPSHFTRRVNGVPTVISVTKPAKDPINVCVVIIPGNPGPIGFYDVFISTLFNASDRRIVVYGVSHAGHSSVHLEDDDEEPAVLLRADAFPPFTLEDQVEHKLAFLNYHIAPEYKLILIGHSIGAHIILQILKRLDDKGDRVLKAVLLFPTIERITTSPSGKFWGALSSYFNYPLALIAFLFSLMPRSVQRSAIEWWLYFSNFSLHSSTVNATLSFLNYHSMMHSLQTGRDIACVCDVDYEPIAKNLEKLIFYYGIDDPYVPTSYIDDMRERFPAADIKICKDSIKHAFVLDSSEKMANIVWKWLFMDLV